MFFKNFKKHMLLFLLSFIIIPQSLFAYSDKILVGGNAVGIRLNTNGILIVGSYDINNHNPLNESGLKEGDLIVDINNTKVNKIEEMVNIIENCNCNSLYHM